MKFRTFYLICIICLSPLLSTLQAQPFSRQDTLRGMITPERAWWDLTYYHLSVKVILEEKALKGTNTIQYKVLKAHDRMQIDLQEPMQITRISQEGRDLAFTQEGKAWFIDVGKQDQGSLKEITIYFEGIPQESANPPWAGGLTWTKDFVVTTCQGDGASLWWPCKDHMYDEPDSMMISVNVPDNLMDVSNGQLVKVDPHPDGTKTYHWFVANPISNYVVNLNIADYRHFSETYHGEKGALTCDYYVLEENLPKAKKQFQEVPRMLQAFEHWFGPYPFYEDGFKLVEVPYAGMEHQSSVTYGNYFKNGYRGRDVSFTGIGMKFDFIIVHEAGHEWFANNITYKDIADMWVHESFTAYSESLFVEYHFGKAEGYKYIRGTRANIRNDRPIQGVFDVNARGSSDMYSKGANMLHTLRQVINNDEKWREILRGLNSHFYHQTVSGSQIEQYIDDQSTRNLIPFFDQYLRDHRLPVFEYVVRGNTLAYRWSNCIPSFNMPLRIYINGNRQAISPTTQWNEIPLAQKEVQITLDPNYYVAELNLVK